MTIANAPLPSLLLPFMPNTPNNNARITAGSRTCSVRIHRYFDLGRIKLKSTEIQWCDHKKNFTRLFLKQNGESKAFPWMKAFKFW